jgi:rubrerythrin
MSKPNSQQNMAEFINCLSLLETSTSLLYKSISEKVQWPLIKKLLNEITLDSEKHANILKSISESIGQPVAKQKDCAKKIGESWLVLSVLEREIAEMKKIGFDEVPRLAKKLAVLESVMGEEYLVLVELKTLQYMSKQINQLYPMDLSKFKGVFTKIINEEEHHREILESIQQLIAKDEKVEYNPVVSFKTLTLEANLLEH